MNLRDIFKVIMKLFRMRFRGLTVLAIIAVLSLLLIYLPPAYRQRQFLLASSYSATNNLGEEIIQVQQQDKILTSTPAKENLSHHSRLPQPQENLQQVLQHPNISASVSIVPNEEESSGYKELPVVPSEEVDTNPLKDANEHDSYVQDYPDYTPSGFVEVKKDKPAPSKHPGQKMLQHPRNEKPARLKLNSFSTSGEQDSFYSPEALRKRALTFSNTSTLRLFLEEQDRRANHVSKTCPDINIASFNSQNRGIGPPPGLSGLHNLLLDRINHITYCPIYKAASTSWTITLLEIGGYWKKEKGRFKRLQTTVQQVYPKISNFAGPQLTKGTTRFMVVRHPLERLLSCFRDKFEMARKTYYYTRYGEKMVRHYRQFSKDITPSQLSMLEAQVRAKVKAEVPVNLPGNPYAEPLGPTFDEFAQYVIRVKHDDEHWRPYYDHCSPCFMDYQFILRFENLNEEGKEFIQYLNRTSKVNMRWDNPTQGGNTNDEVICSYYSQLNSTTIKSLIKKYDKDFKLFEYDPDKYSKCAKDKRERRKSLYSEKPHG